MFKSLLTPLREFIETLAPNPETLARQEAQALREACCVLLMEVARLDDAHAERKRQMVAQGLREQFELADQELRSMIDHAGRHENRPTSYFKSIRLLNQGFDLARKAHFVEQLWRVAMVDGNIDRYEDHLVRKLSDLLYVPHADFILAKNRVQAGLATQAG